MISVLEGHVQPEVGLDSSLKVKAATLQAKDGLDFSEAKIQPNL